MAAEGIKRRKDGEKEERCRREESAEEEERQAEEERHKMCFVAAEEIDGVGDELSRLVLLSTRCGVRYSHGVIL